MPSLSFDGSSFVSGLVVESLLLYYTRKRPIETLVIPTGQTCERVEEETSAHIPGPP